MNNITELTPLITPALMVPLLPLIGFFVVALFGKKLGHASGWIASLMILASFICSLFLFNGLSSGKSLNFDVYEWIKFGETSLTFGFLIDQLSLVML